MRNNVMTGDRQCPHCAAKYTMGLRYYHEGPRGLDYYYCENCYGMVTWDGLNMVSIQGEAYPNREQN